MAQSPAAGWVHTGPVVLPVGPTPLAHCDSDTLTIAPPAEQRPAPCVLASPEEPRGFTAGDPEALAPCPGSCERWGPPAASSAARAFLGCLQPSLSARCRFGKSVCRVVTGTQSRGSPPPAAAPVCFCR